MPSDSPDWDNVLMGSANTLIQGAKSDLDECVSALTPFCPPPVVTLEDPVVNTLATIKEGSVILERVARYSLEDQRAILSWLDGDGSGVRLIATTSERLFDLVQGGQFIDTLYYRLNVIFIDLTPDSVLSIVTSLFGG